MKQNLKKIITDVNSEFLKCVFDTGNRITLTHSIGDEIRILSSLMVIYTLKTKIRMPKMAIRRGMVDFLEVFRL